MVTDANGAAQRSQQAAETAATDERVAKQQRREGVRGEAAH